MNKEKDNNIDQIQNMYSNIHMIMKKRGLKWKDLAVLTGISAATLSSMKSQNQIPGVMTIKKIADALDVSVDEILDDGTKKSQALYDLCWEISRLIPDIDAQRISCIHMKYIVHAIANPDEIVEPLLRDEISKKEVLEKLKSLTGEA